MMMTMMTTMATVTMTMMATVMMKMMMATMMATAMSMQSHRTRIAGYARAAARRAGARWSVQCIQHYHLTHYWRPGIEKPWIFH